MMKLLLPSVSACIFAFALAALASADAVQDRLSAAFAPLEAVSRTGVLADRVAPIVPLERLDGTAAAPALDAAGFRQAWDEIARASIRARRGPAAADLARDGRDAAPGTIPLAVLDVAYERLRPDAAARGAIAVEGDRIVQAAAGALVAGRVTAAAALVHATYRGAALTFTLAREHVLADAAPRAIAVDFADGRGFRDVAPGTPVRVAYASPGTRTLALRLERADGSVAIARFTLAVEALATPAPDDTLHVTATVPYQGVYGTGDAYVALAPGHAAIENPAVVIEGLDLDNSMNWDELYALLDRENLLESLRADGFDVIVLNFTDATHPVQENAFVVERLIEEVQDLVAPSRTLALVGASMGGLCSRYALAWMEQHGVPHRVRVWLSFDGPHGGANVPLGMQYWIDFFAGQSADAATFRDELNSPAARQQLVYHYTSPPTPAAADPLRAGLLADLAAVGDWPQLTRRVAIVNGSGQRQTQGFAPAAQCIRWEYSSFAVAITGDVWAVPDHMNAVVFQGSTRILFSTTSRTVSVSTTAPWDGAPGGWRASFAQLDSVAAPYGDIVALHPNHAFVPVVSALALATADPFYDVAGDPDLVSHTPFDAVYVPASNQEHVLVTPENAVWVRTEIEAGLLAAPGARTAAALALAAGPNPCAGAARVTFTLPDADDVTLTVADVAGRTVRTLARGRLAAGVHAATWDGRDAAGARVAAGVYFVRLSAGARTAVKRLVRLD